LKAKITSSLSRFGYSHIQKEHIELPDLQALCQENGWIVTDTDACYTYTVMDANGKQGGNTDWDAVRQQQFERRQKAAQRKKKKDTLL
jgi:hypothetical protein